VRRTGYCCWCGRARRDPWGVTQPALAPRPRRTSVQLFWTNVNSSLALVAQMLSASTTPAELVPVGAMAPAETQLDESLPRTWQRAMGGRVGMFV